MPVIDRRRSMHLCAERAGDISIAATCDAIVQCRFGSGADDDDDSTEESAANDRGSATHHEVSIERGAVVRCAQKPLIRCRAAGMLHGRRRSQDLASCRGRRSEPAHSFRLEKFVRTYIRHSDLSCDAVASAPARSAGCGRIIRRYSGRCRGRSQKCDDERLSGMATGARCGP
jgi:hypothetical protein